MDAISNTGQSLNVPVFSEKAGLACKIKLIVQARPVHKHTVHGPVRNNLQPAFCYLLQMLILWLPAQIWQSKAT